MSSLPILCCSLQLVLIRAEAALQHGSRLGFVAAQPWITFSGRLNPHHFLAHPGDDSPTHYEI